MLRLRNGLGINNERNNTLRYRKYKKRKEKTTDAYECRQRSEKTKKEL